jgi:hypothetical protein
LGSSSSPGQATGELVEVAVGSADVDPFPATVALGGAHDVKAGSLELTARQLDVVNFEELDGPCACSPKNS